MGGLTKQGAGTLTLNGASNYSGTTTVEAGALVVNGSIAGSTTSVNSGATLSGTGSLGNVYIASGGTMAPGNSPGSITTGFFVLADGAHFQLELGGEGEGESDQVHTGGLVYLEGDLQISLYGAYAPVIGDKFFIIVNHSSPSVYGSFSNDDAQQRITTGSAIYSVNYADNFDGSVYFNDVSLTVFAVIPEPGTAALLGLPLAFLLARLLSRRRHNNRLG